MDIIKHKYIKKLNESDNSKLIRIPTLNVNESDNSKLIRIPTVLFISFTNHSHFKLEAMPKQRIANKNKYNIFKQRIVNKNKSNKFKQKIANKNKSNIFTVYVSKTTHQQPQFHTVYKTQNHNFTQFKKHRISNKTMSKHIHCIYIQNNSTTTITDS